MADPKLDELVRRAGGAAGIDPVAAASAMVRPVPPFLVKPPTPPTPKAGVVQLVAPQFFGVVPNNVQNLAAYNLVLGAGQVASQSQMPSTQPISGPNVGLAQPSQIGAYSPSQGQWFPEDVSAKIPGMVGPGPIRQGLPPGLIFFGPPPREARLVSSGAMPGGLVFADPDPEEERRKRDQEIGANMGGMDSDDEKARAEHRKALLGLGKRWGSTFAEVARKSAVTDRAKKALDDILDELKKYWECLASLHHAIYVYDEDKDRFVPRSDSEILDNLEAARDMLKCLKDGPQADDAKVALDLLDEIKKFKDDGKDPWPLIGALRDRAMILENKVRQDKER